MRKILINNIWITLFQFIDSLSIYYRITKIMMDEVLSVSAYVTQETESETNFMDNSLLKKCDPGEARMMEKEMRPARRKTI